MPPPSAPRRRQLQARAKGQPAPSEATGARKIERFFRSAGYTTVARAAGGDLAELQMIAGVDFDDPELTHMVHMLR